MVVQMRTLKQWSTNFSVNQNHQEGLLKEMVGLQPISDSVGVEWDPSDVYVAGPGTTLSESLVEKVECCGRKKINSLLI